MLEIPKSEMNYIQVRTVLNLDYAFNEYSVSETDDNWLVSVDHGEDWARDSLRLAIAWLKIIW